MRHLVRPGKEHRRRFVLSGRAPAKTKPRTNPGPASSRGERGMDPKRAKDRGHNPKLCRARASEAERGRAKRSPQRGTQHATATDSDRDRRRPADNEAGGDERLRDDRTAQQVPEGRRHPIFGSPLLLSRGHPSLERARVWLTLWLALIADWCWVPVDDGCLVRSRLRRSLPVAVVPR